MKVNGKELKLKEYDIYWTTGTNGRGYETLWVNDEVDHARLKIGRVHLTRKEAEEAYSDFQREKNYLMNLIEGSSNFIDWDNNNQIKYYLYYDYTNKEVCIGDDLHLRNQGTAYTSNKEALQIILDENTERIEKFLFEVV